MVRSRFAWPVAVQSCSRLGRDACAARLGRAHGTVGTRVLDDTVGTCMLHGSVEAHGYCGSDARLGHDVTKA